MIPYCQYYGSKGLHTQTCTRMRFVAQLAITCSSGRCSKIYVTHESIYYMKYINAIHTVDTPPEHLMLSLYKSRVVTCYFDQPVAIENISSTFPIHCLPRCTHHTRCVLLKRGTAQLLAPAHSAIQWHYRQSHSQPVNNLDRIPLSASNSQDIHPLSNLDRCIHQASTLRSHACGMDFEDGGMRFGSREPHDPSQVDPHKFQS